MQSIYQQRAVKQLYVVTDSVKHFMKFQKLLMDSWTQWKWLGQTCRHITKNDCVKQRRTKPVCWNKGIIFQNAVEFHENSRDIKANLPSCNQPESNHCFGRKIAGNGLNYDHLALTFEKYPSKGLRDLWWEHCGSLDLYTKSQKMFDKIVDYFVK